MATVRLYLDRGGYELPDVCMRCGAPATKRTSKVFSWHPPWSGLCMWPFVALMLTQRRRIEAPLCQRHRYHWSARQAFLLGAAVASIGLVVALTLTDPRPGQRPLVPDAAWLGLPLLLLVWLFPVRILQRQAIHPTEITTHTITLTGVSEGFVQAVDEYEDVYRHGRSGAVGEKWRDRHLPSAGASEKVQPSEDYDRVRRPHQGPDDKESGSR